jgi:DNA-binding response OmpR family regulator
MSSPPNTNPGHILIVEDDAAIHLMLSETLGESGFAVTTATSGAEMDRALSREAVDLVVLDVMLPGEDGFSICSRLRASSNLPILMLTALGEDVDRIVGLEIGADDYVTKPFNSRELVAPCCGGAALSASRPAVVSARCVSPAGGCFRRRGASSAPRGSG